MLYQTVSPIYGRRITLHLANAPNPTNGGSMDQPQTALIKQELLRIPSGDSAQQLFRMVYEILRLRDLRTNDPPRVPGEVFGKAVKDVRRHHAGFLPLVTDPGYFDLPSGQYQMPQ